ncbi:MAG: NAAT family transporter [Chlamydiales bacterium]|nr:NAAT family transporter [Chlamydiales bacterium]
METLWTILAISFALFLLLDPIGNVPLFLTILKDFSAARRRAIIIREMCIALVVIIAFNFVGDGILTLLSVKEYTTMMAGGIILFLISLKMIFPEKTSEADLMPRKEPYIVPLAIPLVAGPAVLAAVMIFSKNHSYAITIPAIFIAWAVSALILLASTHLKKFMGDRGIIALERLMGLILTLIAVQMFLGGVSLYVDTHAH